jgi:hypothetical protein
MAKSHGERELSTRRHSAHRGSIGGQREVETQLRPSAQVRYEELLVCREPLRVKCEGVRALSR